VKKYTIKIRELPRVYVTGTMTNFDDLYLLMNKVHETKNSKMAFAIVNTREHDSDSWIYIVWGFGISIFLLNTFQLYVMFKDRKTRQSKSMVLIFNLTISDVFFSSLLITHMYFDYRRERLFKKLYTTPFEVSSKLILHLTVQKVFNILTYRFSFLISLLTHVAVACDRLYCLTRPIKYWQYKEQKYMVLTSILIWVVAIIVAGLCLFWEFSLPKIPPRFEKNLEQMGSLSIPVVAGLIVSAVYVFIIWTHRKNNNNIESQTDAVSANDIRRKEQEKSLMKMSLAIVCSFYLCWMPTCCESLLRREFGYTYNHILSNVFALMMISNPLLNTIFYFPKTRRLVFSFLSKLFCCRRN